MRRILRGLGSRQNLHYHIRGRDFTRIGNGHGLRFRFRKTSAIVRANICEVISEMDANPHYELRLILNHKDRVEEDVSLIARRLKMAQVRKLISRIVGRDLSKDAPSSFTNIYR